MGFPNNPHASPGSVTGKGRVSGRGSCDTSLARTTCDHSAPASLVLEACAKFGSAAVIPYHQHGQEKCSLQPVMPAVMHPRKECQDEC